MTSSSNGESWTNLRRLTHEISSALHWNGFSFAGGYLLRNNHKIPTVMSLAWGSEELYEIQGTIIHHTVLSRGIN